MAAIEAVDEVDERGHTKLILACARHNPVEDLARVNALLDAGAAVDATNREGATALLVAARTTCEVGVVKCLLAANANVNHADSQGWSALCNAAQLAKEEKALDVSGIKALIDAGANVNHVNNEGFSSLVIAAMADHNLDHNPAAVAAAAKIVDLLLEAKADVTHATPEGHTALVAAAGIDGDSNDIVSRLLRAEGCDPNHVTPDQDTALMFAASAGNVGAVRALVEAKARVDLKDSDGKTAMNLAAEYGHRAIVQALVEALRQT